jgi:predicted RNA binding protein YcfA (HicA-like mRNA interferase family)
MKSVSGKYLCKILEQHGWRLQRISGSHYIYEKDGVEAIAVVPVHANRDMRIGTLKTILRATGLTEQDL